MEEKSYQQENIKPYSQEEDKREQIENMFNFIAPKYDLLNHLLSLGLDKSWRRQAIDSLKEHNPKQILDIATGTGDFACLAYQRLGQPDVIGVDICDGMMDVGRKKVERLGIAEHVSFQKGDCCERLPFEDCTQDAVTIAFGARNFVHLDKGLMEMFRVLKKGCPMVLIELTPPNRFPMKQLFWIYAHVVMPIIGRLISHDNSAYTYLPKSMEAFPQAEELCPDLKRIGFSRIEFRRFTFGICTLYKAIK